MVATRKVPTSRTSGTPPTTTPATPRAVKTKAERELKPNNGANNAAETVKHAKLKTRNKAKRDSKSKKSQSKSLADVLSQVLILFFLIYTLSVCPNDESLEKPICRGLSAYRKLVLEPYVFPTVQQYVVQPVERKIIPLVVETLDKPNVRPYVAKYTALQNNWVIPAAHKSAGVWNTRVAPQWRRRVVPGWNKYVVPQWNRRVVPAWNTYVVPQWEMHVVTNYNKHITPRWDKYASPWVVKSRVYLHHVRIWARQAHAQYVIFETKSRPYIAYAAAKSQDAMVKAKELYVLSSPYIEHMRVILARLLNLLKAQRVMYVDPHVARLWDKIVELSTTSDRAPTTPKGEFKIQTEAIKETVVVSAISSSVVAGESAASVVLESLLGESASSILPSETSSSAALEASASATLDLESEAVASPAAEESPVVASTKLTASIKDTSSEAPSPSASSGSPSSTVVPSTTPSEIIEPTSTESRETASENAQITSAASVVLQSAHPDAMTAPAVVNAKDDLSVLAEILADTATKAANEETGSAEFDEDAALKDFFAEFDPDNTGNDSNEISAEDEVDPEEARVAAEEALRLKKEATAAKREWITGRHTEWEEKLVALRDEQRTAMRSGLLAVREDAIKELHGKKAPRDSAIDARGLVDTLASDGEKFLKGIESYLKTMSTKKANTNGDGYEKWITILHKVNDKFGEKVTELEGKVHEWYVEVIEKELEEARQASGLVLRLAQQAQGDIGLDYAWLDDVSYSDWQRYHDLVRLSEKFDVELAHIQNGTTSASHPATEPIVPNMLLDALDELQAEVHDVVLGFETRLRGIKRAGERAFKEVENATEDEAPAQKVESTVSILPIPVETSEAEPTVSILPIEESTVAATPTNSEEVAAQQTAAQIVLGRSEKEVLQALERAEEGPSVDRVEL